MSGDDYSAIALAAGAFVTKCPNLFSEAVTWWNENWGRGSQRRVHAKLFRRQRKIEWGWKHKEDKFRSEMRALGPEGEKWFAEHPDPLPSARGVNDRVRKNLEWLGSLELGERLGDAVGEEFFDNFRDDGGHSMSSRDALRILLVVAVDRHSDYDWKSLVDLDERPSDEPPQLHEEGFLWDHLVKVAWEMTEHLRSISDIDTPAGGEDQIVRAVPPNELRRGDRAVRIGAIPWKLLHFLLNNSQALVRDVEMDIWGDESETDSRLKNTIHRANAALLQVGSTLQVTRTGEYLTLG